MSVISKASFVNVPSGYGEDNLYSEVPNTTAGDFTFTRASTGTRVNADGYIEEVPWNLITYSEDFSNSSYVKDSGVTIGTTNNVSPIGNNTATQINVTDSGRIYKNVTSAQYRTSVYLKAGTFAYFKVIGQNVDLNLGTITSSYPNEIVDVGNGWFRISISYLTTIRPWQIQAFPDDTYSTHTTSGNYFVWGAMLNYGDTTKTYIKTTDRLNIPRLDYTNRDCPQLLIEKQATNLVTYSEDLDSNTKLNVVVTSNDIISPDGTQNADKLETTSSNSYKLLKTNSISFVSGNRYAFSFFAKKGTTDFIQLITTNTLFGATSEWANFDLNNGVVSLDNYGGASIEDYGNGWYRCQMISTCVSSGTDGWFVSVITSGTSARAENTTSVVDIYVWGLQVESKYGNQGYKPTSYIPTNGTSVTRNYDYFKSGDLTSVLNTSQGVFYLDFLHYDSIVYGEFTVRPTDNSSANQIYFRTQNINNPEKNITQFSLSASGTTYGNYQWNDAYINMGVKYAFAWDGNVIKHYINGVKKSETTATFSFNADFGEIKMSRYNTPNQYIGFHNPLRQVAYFNEMLTEDELETLTTPIATSFQALVDYYAYERL